MMQVGLMGDCGVEATYKTGKEMKSFVVSFMALPLKISLIIKSLLVTAALGMTGYVAGMQITQGVIDGFYTAYLLWSSIICLLACVCVLFYKLPEAKVAEMTKENNRRAMEDEKAVEEALAKMK